MNLPTVLLLSISVFTAQQLTAQEAAACGADGQKFNVTLDKTQHTVAAPEAGKALLVFVEDIGGKKPLQTGLVASVKVGADGSWVGALKNDSWFAVAVDPGVRHICLTTQERLFSPVTELLRVTVEPGQTYYVRIRNFMWQTRRLEVAETNEDQGRYMVSGSAQARAVAKK